jgi:hypothetical protein
MISKAGLCIQGTGRRTTRKSSGKPIECCDRLWRVVNPNCAEYAASCKAYGCVRADGVWFIQIANGFGANREYTEEERNAFRNDPKVLVPHTRDIEGRVNGIWGVFYSGSEMR